MAEITDTTYLWSIAAAVRAEFSRLGRRQKDLAEVIGKSRPTASDKWHGRKGYTTEEIDQISDYLGITPYNLTDSAELAAGFVDVAHVPEAARITPPQQDAWAQPSRARARRAS